MSITNDNNHRQYLKLNYWVEENTLCELILTVAYCVLIYMTSHVVKGRLRTFDYNLFYTKAVSENNIFNQLYWQLCTFWRLLVNIYFFFVLSIIIHLSIKIDFLILLLFIFFLFRKLRCQDYTYLYKLLFLYKLNK